MDGIGQRYVYYGAGKRIVSKLKTTKTPYIIRATDIYTWEIQYLVHGI
jgi:hypothetical protein